MGFFDRFILKQERAKIMDNYFKMINAYSPAFRTFNGGVYEMDLTRAAIHTFAKHAAKASPIIKGGVYSRLESALKTRPNEIMTASQFIYKVATIYKAENNVFLIPLYEDRSAGKIVGLYPVRGADTRIKRVGSKLMLIYSVYPNGSPIEHAIPYEEVGHLRSHFYRNEIYGEGNNPLNSTMQLLNTQQQAIINSVEQSATIRFMAKVSTMLQPGDAKAEQKRLRDMNLNIENNGGIFLYDNKYADVKQVDSKPYTIDSDQVKQIKDNVYNYFGTNEAIIQNSANEHQWEAYYEGELEPFLIELSQVITNMLFSAKQIDNGSMVVYEAQRLQYASTKTKLELVVQLFDRGFITHNEGREVFNLAPVENGDHYFIRREYMDMKEVEENLIEEGKVNDNKG